MMLFYLPVEILLHVGSYISREDLISFATICKGIRKVFMTQILGGTIQIRSPLPDFPNIFDIFNFLHLRMPGLQNCIDQVTFYQQRSDLARSVHTIQITNWITPSPQRFLSTASELAEREPKCQALIEEFQSDQYYPNALMQFCSVYDSIVVNLVQCLPFSELRLIRTHITANMHPTLHKITLRRLALEDCIFEAIDVSAYVGHLGRYDSFKGTSGDSDQLPWRKYLPWNDSDPDTRGIYIRIYLFWGCLTITKLEICVEFLQDDALEVLFLPSLTSLAIVPHANIVRDVWSWETVYLLLKISPNLTCFRFEPIRHPPDYIWPFDTYDNWREYKRRIGNLPLSQLSSITAYRPLVTCLVPGRPVSFAQILLFPDIMDPEINWSDSDSDDEDIGYHKRRCIVPYQLARSATPVKTLYLQRMDEQQDLKVRMLLDHDIECLHDACPYVTHLWIPGVVLLSRIHHHGEPVELEEALHILRSFDELEQCAIGYCSPWVAKELEWYREGTILPERMHPTLKELLLAVDVLWKWQDDSEVTGWVLYVSTDIEGSEDSEEGIHPRKTRYAESATSEDLESALEDDRCIPNYEYCSF